MKKKKSRLKRFDKSKPRVGSCVVVLSSHAAGTSTKCPMAARNGVDGIKRERKKERETCLEEERNQSPNDKFCWDGEMALQNELITCTT